MAFDRKDGNAMFDLPTHFEIAMIEAPWAVRALPGMEMTWVGCRGERKGRNSLGRHKRQAGAFPTAGQVKRGLRDSRSDLIVLKIAYIHIVST